MPRELADRPAEAAVLGAILIDEKPERRTFARVALVLRASDFHDPRHGLVFQVMQDLAHRGEAIDNITVGSELRARNRLNTVGTALIGELTEAIPTGVHVEDHAGCVLRLSQARAAMEVLAVARQTITQGAHDATDVVARAMEQLATVRARGDRNRERSFAQHVDDALERLTSAMGGEGREVPTGIRAFDGHRESGELGATGGMFDGELWVLAAESSGGKTAMALQIARHVAQQRRRVLFFSFEMDARRIVWRLTAPDHGVPMARIKRGQVSPDDVRALQQATDAVRDLPIEIRGTCTIEEIEGAVLAARAAAGGDDLGLVVVDYLGLIPPTPRVDDRKEDHQRVTRYTRALKKLAQRAGVPVLLLAQFTREGNKSGKPTKHDLKGGGAIESDADVIVILHVEEKNRKLPKREVNVILAKNRDAKLCDFVQVFDGERQTFSPPADDADVAPDPRRYVRAPAPFDPDERDPVPFGYFSGGGDAE